MTHGGFTSKFTTVVRLCGWSAFVMVPSVTGLAGVAQWHHLELEAKQIV